MSCVSSLFQQNTITHALPGRNGILLFPPMSSESLRILKSLAEGGAPATSYSYISCRGCNQRILIRPFVIRPRSLSINSSNAAAPPHASNQRSRACVCHSSESPKAPAWRCIARRRPPSEREARLNSKPVSLFQSADFETNGDPNQTF